MQINRYFALFTILCFALAVSLPPAASPAPISSQQPQNPQIAWFAVIAIVAVVVLLTTSQSCDNNQTVLQKNRNWTQVLEKAIEHGQDITKSDMKCTAGQNTTAGVKIDVKKGGVTVGTESTVDDIVVKDHVSCNNPQAGPGTDLSSYGNTQTQQTFQNGSQTAACQINLDFYVDTLKVQIGQTDAIPLLDQYGEVTYNFTGGVALADSITSPSQKITLLTTAFTMRYDHDGVPEFTVSGDLAGRFTGPTVEPIPGGTSAYTFKIIHQHIPKSYSPAVHIQPGERFLTWTDHTITTAAESGAIAVPMFSKASLLLVTIVALLMGGYFLKRRRVSLDFA